MRAYLQGLLAPGGVGLGHEGHAFFLLFWGTFRVGVARGERVFRALSQQLRATHVGTCTQFIPLRSPHTVLTRSAVKM